jgi:CheY-like chemotaxis protein
MAKVLIIDDEPEWERLVKLILEREREDEVLFAPGGRQGLIVAEQECPDLIILDIMMPDLDGWEVYQRLKAIPDLQATPIIFQAAMSPKRVYPKAQRVGATGYVCEPYAPKDLLAARDAALQGDTYYPPLPESSTPSRADEGTEE